MKRLLIGTAVAGGAAFAFRRLAGKARKMHDHCRDMIAGCQAAEPKESKPWLMRDHQQANDWR